MKKPNLFIVGQPKAGTTALHNFLSQHPDIFMSVVKEPHFFCSDFHQQSDRFYQKRLFFKYRDINSYIKLFDKADSFKIAGEASIHYLYSEVAAREIYEFNPEAKIIIMLREPAAWLYSLHNQFLNVQIETERDFVRALKLENDRKQGQHIPSRVICPSWLYYSERVRYCEQIKRFYDFFEPRKVKVIIFEDWRNDNSKLYREILSFLEVDERIEPEYKSINLRSTPKFQIVNNIIYNPLLRKIAQNIVPDSTYEFITKKIIDRYLFKPAKKEHNVLSLDLETKKSIMPAFYQEVIKISELLNIDLVEKWGYKNI